MLLKTIQVATPSAQYPVLIGPGILPTLYPRLRKLSKAKLVVITSPNIWTLWSKEFLASFPPQDQPAILTLPPGEKHKRLPAIESLAEQLAQQGADRDTLLIAFGGGVLGDITGFLAAIYMRGIPFVQVPTTLLAQVDSSVGGKTGVNLAAGKNLLGSFHQPRAVFADTDLLRTLPRPELFAGLQESIKAAIIRDPRFFTFLERNREKIQAASGEPDPATLARIVATSVQIKADVVAADEHEQNLRMILNFGHTIGHAIEAATNYKQLLHGEAIAWGMIAALHVALARQTITPDQFARMANLILAFAPLPTFKAKAQQLVALTAADKKNRSGRRAFILPTAIGKAEVVHTITDEELLTATQRMLDDMQSSKP